MLTTFNIFFAAVFEINRSLNTMAARFATPEVSSTTHVSTGVEIFTSVHNILDMKEFNTICKVDVLQQALSTDEAFKQIEKRAENGSQHIFVWLTQENYKKAINSGNVVVIPDDNMAPKWSHWICTTTVHDCLTTAAYQLSQLHTTTSNMSLLYMVVFELDPGQRWVCNRIWNHQLVQQIWMPHTVPSPQRVQDEQQGRFNQNHFALHGQVANLFDTYDWQHGYAWAFNMVIKVTDALAEQENVNS